MGIDFKDYLYYDESSPSKLRWKFTRYKGQYLQVVTVAKDSVAGFKDSKGYWIIKINYKEYQGHRVLLEVLGNNISGKLVDHRDGNPSNNNLTNLCITTKRGNCHNAKRLRNNTSGKSGVRFDNKPHPCKTKHSLYAIAYWCLHGVGHHPKTKAFSVKKFGLLPAFKMACEYRDKMIAELNAQGAGYTERHGQ